ncbi:hypothetical protein HDU88_007967 [Geranomyces variabilis]|nr:hypothetical protein HDU88_007967 [Geranomyces variabilis]
MLFDMRATITGVAESMQHMSIQTGRGTQVALDLDAQIPRSVNGNLTKVQQILANLVGIATISSLAKSAALKAAFQALDGGAAEIHFIIKGVQSQTRKPLLEGFDLKFSFEDLSKPLTPVNLSHGVVICREVLKQLGSRLHVEVDARLADFRILAGCHRCIATGMDDYFTKPITMKTLAEMLHKWLGMGLFRF